MLRVDCRVSDAGLRFPFVPHLPALPAINPRGELEGRIFRRCRLNVSGLPPTAVLRYRRRPSSKFPWNLYPPAPADEAPRVSSVRSPSGFARENLRVTPNLLWPLAPSTYLAPYRHGASVVRRCRWTELRFAPNPCPSACRPCFLESPRFAWTAGSMMNPVCSRTLHPRIAPWMNLRVQSGFAVFT